MVRFIIQQLSRLKPVSNRTESQESTTKLHDRAARIIAYTISGLKVNLLKKRFGSTVHHSNSKFRIDGHGETCESGKENNHHHDEECDT
jgi:hypothetical protein